MYLLRNHLPSISVPPEIIENLWFNYGFLMISGGINKQLKNLLKFAYCSRSEVWTRSLSVEIPVQSQQ